MLLRISPSTPVRHVLRVLFVATLLGAWAFGAITLDPRRLTHKALRLAQRIDESRTRWIEPRTEAHAAGFALADEKRGFIVFERSVLKRIYSNSQPGADETAPVIRWQAAWGEYEPAQIGVRALRDLGAVIVEPSELQDDRGNTLPASAIDVRMERFYSLQLSIKTTNRIGVVPKTLEPAVTIALPANTTRPYWLTVHVPDGQAGGLYKGTVKVRNGDATLSVPIELEILPRRLDEPDTMLGPLSLSVLRAYPRAKEADADQIAARADLIFRDIREHGMTTLSLWSGDVVRSEDNGRVVLPDLDVAMELFKKYRFPQPMVYAPVNVLATNKIGTSSSYKNYDPSIHVPLADSIVRTYTRRASELGLPGIFFDPVEEPNYISGVARGDAPDTRQRIANELLRTMKKAGAKTFLTSQPDTAHVGGGDVDLRLFAFKRFVPRVLTDAPTSRERVGLYANGTLMGNGTYFSRFFFGYWPWAMRVRAMMAWTYPMTPKRFPANVGGTAEGGLNLQEGFLGADGRPVPVIQWELAREGVDDFRYLVTLEHLVERTRESKDPAARRASDEAATFLASLRTSISPDVHLYEFEDPTTFEAMPAAGWDDAKFAATRKQSFELVKKLSGHVH